MTKHAKETNPNIVSRAEFARLQGYGRARVTQLANEGRLVLAENGKDVYVIESIARIEATRDLSKIGTVERHAKARQEKTTILSDEIVELRSELRRKNQIIENHEEDFKTVCELHNGKVDHLEAIQQMATMLNDGVGEFLDDFRSKDSALMQAIENNDVDFLERQIYKLVVVPDYLKNLKNDE